MTSATANAIAITLDSGARSAYDRQTRAEDAATGEAGQTVGEFTSTLGQLASLMPGAVKVH